MTIMLRALGAVCPTAFGLDFRLVGRLHGAPGGTRVRCANGFWMTGDTNNAGFISGLSERAYMRTLAALMRPGDLVYDVGANVGYVALWLAQHFARRGGLRLVGFEADPGTAGLMRRNAALNPALEVRVEAQGLGDFDGTARFHTAGPGDGAASLGERHTHGAAVHDVEVAIARLDTYQRRAARAPDWLVIDVEGFGGGVLRGGQDTIAAARPRVAAEIHSPAERREIEQVLEPLGYRVARELSSIWGTHVIWTPKSS